MAIQTTLFSLWQAKIKCAQASSYFHGTLRDINEPENISLVCKYKHMFKNGAPPDNVQFLYILSRMKFYGVNNLIVSLRHPFGSWFPFKLQKFQFYSTVVGGTNIWINSVWKVRILYSCFSKDFFNNFKHIVLH